MTAVCENCASEDEELTPVWPAAGTLATPELWCEDCRSRFPNDPADGEEEDG